jgi:hypothetical protein
MRLYAAPLLFALVTALLIPISASAWTDAECAAVYDWDGTRVGRVHDSGDGDAAVLFAHEGRVAKIVFVRDSILSSAVVNFTGTNCTGDAYMGTSGQVVKAATVVGNDVWYQDMGAVEASGIATSSHIAADGSCNNATGSTHNAVPAYTFTLPTFTPPFYLEPEACYTPPSAVAALTPYSLGAMALVLAFGSYLTMRRPQVA